MESGTWGIDEVQRSAARWRQRTKNRGRVLPATSALGFCLGRRRRSFSPDSVLNGDQVSEATRTTTILRACEERASDGANRAASKLGHEEEEEGCGPKC
jgi:hypothetical protein